MITTRLRPAAGSCAMDVFSKRPVFATTALPGLCCLRSRAGMWPELPPSSWTNVLRIGSLCPGLGLSCVRSVRGDERSWLALGARVTINRNCSHSARLGENRTRSGGDGPLQAHRWHRRHHRGQYCTAALVETRSIESIGYCSLLFFGMSNDHPDPPPSNR
jgi:hypothetical protein